MSRPQQNPIVLRTAAAWGTTVLASRILGAGQSLVVGDGEDAIVAKPDNAAVAESPIRAVGAGWELDARGATGGEVHLRGRSENPALLGRSGAPIPIVAGDWGLIQYGSFSVFFQFTDSPPALGKRRRIGWPMVLSFIFSCLAVGGGLALIWAITTPPMIPKPLELTSDADLALQFNIKPEDLIPEPSVGKEEDKGQGIKDPGAKDKKEQGGGKKIQGAEGKLGRDGKEKKTEQTGEPHAGLGGMAEVLSSDVGEEVKKTLGTISSVADALGGLRSNNIVLGQGSGFALRGGGPGGGGVGPDGVPFGSGTLNTGWGAGKGGGFGSGSGGPGGRGLGGNGRGGVGDGEGSGSGANERKIAGKDSPKPGQGLSPDQIRRVVVSRQGAFQACYEIAASRDPTLKGGVTVSFSISPGGSVSSVSISNSSLSNPRVEGCITRQFARLQFPTADKPTGAAFPFVFRPGNKR
jgi:hypothetical protein